MAVTLIGDSQMPPIGGAPETPWQAAASILSLRHQCQLPEQGSLLPRGSTADTGLPPRLGAAAHGKESSLEGLLSPCSPVW